MTLMFARQSKIGGRFCRFAVLLLALWLGGLGCVIGCEMGTLAASRDEEHSNVSEDSCPSSGHDCCKKKPKSAEDKEAETRESSAIANIPHGTDAMPSCCPLAIQSADPARKSRFVDAPLVTTASRLLGTPDFQPSNAIPFTRLRVPDRGSTYLRCCVFLI
jgi:hypothetical protein